MAISDELFIIALGYAVNYAILYRKNRLFGNIIYFGLAMALISFSTANINTAVGIMLMIGSVLSLIFDVFKSWQGD